MNPIKPGEKFRVKQTGEIRVATMVNTHVWAMDSLKIDTMYSFDEVEPVVPVVGPSSWPGAESCRMDGGDCEACQ